MNPYVNPTGQQTAPQPLMSGWPMQAAMPVPAAWAAPAAKKPEETYVENILRMNQGKIATIYTTYENNPEWSAKVFKGRVENAARDHVVLSDPDTGMRSIILMIHIDFITFDEELNYDPAFYVR